MIFVAFRGVTRNQFSEETCHEELRTDDHGRQRQVEVGRLGHQPVGHAVVHVVQLADSHDDDGDEAEDEHQRTQKAEKVHGLDAEGGEEPQGYQVQIAVEETVQPAELGLAVLARLMVHHLLADFLEAGVLGQVGDVAVHFAVDFDVLYHLVAIGLQSAVEVVQVFDARHVAGRGVEDLVGRVFDRGS